VCDSCLEKNILAPVSLSYHDRMKLGIITFARHLRDPKARNAQCQASFKDDEWLQALQRISRILLSWWSIWGIEHTRSDALPSAEDFSDLGNEILEGIETPSAEHFSKLGKIIVEGIEETWMKLQSTPAVSTCDANLAWASTAKRSRIKYAPETFLASGSLALADNIEMSIMDDIAFDERKLIRTPDDDKERESGMHKIILDYAGLTDDLATSSRAAMRQLMIAATGAQRKHAIRRVQVSSPYHDRRRTEVPMADMDDIGILFWPLHAALRSLPAVQMMENPTKAALEATKFHESFAKKFLLQCNPPWYARSKAEKYEYLRKWFLSKFSLHLKDECMLPRPGEQRRKRNGASWLGVEITDQEMEQILDDSFSLYCANRT
jgi:hypothetical protein